MVQEKNKRVLLFQMTLLEKKCNISDVLAEPLRAPWLLSQQTACLYRKYKALKMRLFHLKDINIHTEKNVYVEYFQPLQYPSQIKDNF